MGRDDSSGSGRSYRFVPSYSVLLRYIGGVLVVSGKYLAVLRSVVYGSGWKCGGPGASIGKVRGG